MFAKLEGLEKKYMELEQALAQPDVYNDQDQYRKLTKAHADLRDVVELFRRHRSLTQELEENKQLLHDSDPDIKAMAQEEIAAAEAELPELEHKIKEIDPKAFVVVTDAYETFGEGFKQFPEKNEIQAE